jgi:hypothetical protein
MHPEFLVSFRLHVLEPPFQLMVHAPHPLRRHLVLRKVLLPRKDVAGVLDHLEEIDGDFN